MTLQGTIAPQQIQLADGTTRTPLILRLAKPVCVVDPLADPVEQAVSSFQLTGAPSKPGAATVQGMLSTGNYTQYYATSNAIERGPRLQDGVADAMNGQRECMRRWNEVVQRERAIGARVGVVNRQTLYIAGDRIVACEEALARLKVCAARSNCTQAEIDANKPVRVTLPLSQTP